MWIAGRNASRTKALTSRYFVLHLQVKRYRSEDVVSSLLVHPLCGRLLASLPLWIRKRKTSLDGCRVLRVQLLHGLRPVVLTPVTPLVSLLGMAELAGGRSLDRAGRSADGPTGELGRLFTTTNSPPEIIFSCFRGARCPYGATVAVGDGVTKVLLVDIYPVLLTPVSSLLARAFDHDEECWIGSAASSVVRPVIELWLQMIHVQLILTQRPSPLNSFSDLKTAPPKGLS